MAEAIHLALSKIKACLEDEATWTIVQKLSVKVTVLKELPEKVSQIGRELTILNHAIGEKAVPNFNDAVFKGWTAEVRKLAFHVEDVMDNLSHHAHAMEGEKKDFLRKFLIRGAHYALIFSRIADEIVRIEEQIKQIIKLREQWLLPSQLISANYKLDSMEKQSSSYWPLTDGDLVGIEDNRRLLTEWLHSDALERTVITVSGMGGLGKTTLVMNVYEREKMNFPVHAWISVSQKYTVESILRKLIISLGHTKPAAQLDKDVFDLKEEIKGILSGVKYLIVLDDVWDPELFFQMAHALQNLEASRIIITTRNDHVAAIAHPTRQLRLQPLSGAEAFQLFCRRAFYNKGNGCPPELEMVSTSIVDRCQGLPLAIVSISSMLSSLPRTHHVWNQTYNQLRSELANNDNLRGVLNMSYHDLPAHLRNCFLYCSLFPEDYAMQREILVRLWVAEGFVVGIEQSTPEEVAEGYLMELIHRSMLQPVEYDELGRVSTCKMHDIVRDLAFSIGREEMFAFANDYGAAVRIDRDVRRLSICKWREEFGPRVRFPRLRTLVALQTHVSSSVGMQIISESLWLTVLELQDSNIAEVPASIGYLLNLQYIGLRRTRVKSLPESIEKLYNLQTLDIKQTKIQKIPRGISRVKKLRHLLGDRFVDEEQHGFRYFVGMEAPKGLANLKALQTLETVQSSNHLAQQLEKLMQLRSVWIDSISSVHCAELFSTLSKMPLLSSLLLSAIDEDEPLHLEILKPTSTKLHRLIIRGCWAGRTLECSIFQDHGRHLKYLSLSWCQFEEDPLVALAPHVPNLAYLSLNRVRSASILVLPAGGFPQLKTLVLKNMPDVKQLHIMDSALPCIEGLYIVSLRNLERFSQGIESLLSLKKLWLLDLHTDFKDIVDKMQHVEELRV